MRGSVDEVIPNRFHFIWFGKSLPDFAHVAIRSALAQNPGSRATLWHDDSFCPTVETQALSGQGLELRPIFVRELLAAFASRESTENSERLLRIYERLEKPAARANVVRLLVLYLEGGVYLDTDTLTVKDLTPLRRHGAFCGEERILWPSGTWRTDLRPLALNEIRRLCALVPRGYRLHRKMLPYYSLAANNAVVGAISGHPLIQLMLRVAADVPEREWTRRFRLGTHLLQDCLKQYVPSSGARYDEVRVFPPEFFYPVGPEVSKHYFKTYPDPRAIAGELLGEDTYVVHWYASVANLLHRGYGHIRKSAHADVYSYLCERHVTAVEEGASMPLAPLAPLARAPAFESSALVANRTSQSSFGRNQEGSIESSVSLA